MSKSLSVPEKHQLRVARKTLKMSDEAIFILGRPSKEESKAIILRLTGRKVVKN